MSNANAPVPVRKLSFRARDCFGGCHGCEIVFVPANNRQKLCLVCRNDPEASRERGRRAYRRMAEKESPTQKYDRSLRKRHHISLAGKLAILTADEFTCLVCGRVIYDVIKAEIDHHHACCDKKMSCGRCIRGVLHPSCNLRLGHEAPGFTHPYLDAAPERMKRNDAIRLATFAERVAPEADYSVLHHMYLSGVKGNCNPPAG